MESIPSMSELPGKRSIRWVLTDLDLSIRVSVPTSIRPTEAMGISYLARSEAVTVEVERPLAPVYWIAP